MMSDVDFVFEQDAFTPTPITSAIRCVNAFTNGAATFDKWAGLPSLVSSINGFGPALVALTILEGFPHQFDTIMPYLLLAGCPTAFIGLIDGMLERIKSELLKSIRIDYKAIIDACYLYIFTLQILIGIYDSYKTHFNPHDSNKNHPIEVSNQFFIILTSLCSIPAILSIAYNIRNNHQPIKNKIAKTAYRVLEFLITASLVHDICDATIKSADSSTHYTKKLISYGISLSGAVALQYVSNKTPELADKGMEYLSAINFVIFILGYMNALDTDKNDQHHITKNILLFIFASYLLVNTLFAIRVSTREMSPLPKSYGLFGDFGIKERRVELVELPSPKPDEESPLIRNTNPNYGSLN